MSNCRNMAVWASLTLILLVYPLNALAQDFMWVGMDADKIGQWDNGNPDGTPDGHFVLNLNLPAPTEIKSIQVYSSDANGNPVNGQFWDTAGTQWWMLGAFRNGNQLNMHHVPTLGTFSGLVQLDLYCEDSGYFKAGNYFGLKATFGDGTKIDRLTSISSMTNPQNPPSTTQSSPFSSLKFAGNPALIQSRFGNKGNFELVVPLATGGLAHFWRDNDAAGMPWKGPTIFGGTDIYDAVTMIQSNYENPGNLEVIARTGDRLIFFWRDSGPSFAWNGPYPL